MVEQDNRGRYALVGVPKICDSLNGLVNWFQRNRINEEGDMLREPCGQEVNADGEEQCDYGELLPPGESGYRPSAEPMGGPPPVVRTSKPGSNPNAGRAAAAPPPIRRDSKPAAMQAGAPPPIRRDSKPDFGGGGGGAPPINRFVKPK